MSARTSPPHGYSIRYLGAGQWGFAGLDLAWHVAGPTAQMAIDAAWFDATRTHTRTVFAISPGGIVLLPDLAVSRVDAIVACEPGESIADAVARVAEATGHDCAIAGGVARCK